MRDQIEEKVERARIFFESGATKSIKYRKEQLTALKKSIISHQKEIEAALWSDLHKSAEEAYMTEILMVLKEIDLHIKNLKKWAKPIKACSPIYLFPSRSSICYQPLGLALIIAPWNYPLQLILNPLVGAISAGCCTILKPSADAPSTSKIVKKIVEDSFKDPIVELVEGDREETTILLEQKYDIIFFTGSPQFGKIVYQAAAQNLTPVVLELGGKSPCIVDKDADIEVSARRIAWGKWINGGQTCVAPDYLYVHQEVKESLLVAIRESCQEMYGKDPSQSRFYPRIINHRSFDRINRLLKGENIYFGGITERSDKYISPTIIDNVKIDSPIMQEEIFGPLLPVLTFEKIEEVVDFINRREKPLALYYFGKANADILEYTSSGGACINDTIMHVSNPHLPFGGVGNSGMGRYHGKESFLLFSNQKAVVKSPTWIDLPLRYPPYRYFKNIVSRYL